MLRTFNCGVGGVVIVSPEDKEYVLDALKNEDAVEIGRIKGKGLYTVAICPTKLKLMFVFLRIYWVSGESVEFCRGDGKTDAAVPTYPAHSRSLSFEEESWCSNLWQWNQSAGTARLRKRTHS
jgi:hypothetical protein